MTLGAEAATVGGGCSINIRLGSEHLVVSHKAVLLVLCYFDLCYVLTLTNIRQKLELNDTIFDDVIANIDK